MSDVAVTFINQSVDAHNSEVVIFQKNVPPDGMETAWRVIPGSDQGYREAFHFPHAVLGADLLEGVQPGQVVQTSEAAASFSLAGVSSADLVLSGGGGEPHRFSLENVG